MTDNFSVRRDHWTPDDVQDALEGGAATQRGAAGWADPRDDPHRDEIVSTMLRWEPGSLSTTVLIRIATDAMAELFADCFRANDPRGDLQREIFRAKAENILQCATGQDFDVIKVPRRPTAA